MENNTYTSLREFEGQKYISLEEHQKIIQNLSGFWTNFEKVSDALHTTVEDINRLNSIVEK